MVGAIMGRLGQVFGLALYHNRQGLRYALEIALGHVDEPDMEEFHQTSVLKVEFVSARELTSPERQRVKKAGFKPLPGGRKMWPSFQSMRPGCVPWHIDLAEAEVLRYALPRLTALGRCVQPVYETDHFSPEDGFAFWPRGRSLDSPLRAEEVEWRQLSVPATPAPKPFVLDEITEQKLAKLPQIHGQILELDAFSGFGIIDEGERPWFVKMGAVAESQSGLIMAAEMGELPGEPLETLAGRTLVRALQTLDARPTNIRVRRVGIQQALDPVAKRLGVRLELRRELPRLAEFQAATRQRFG